MYATVQKESGKKHQTDDIACSGYPFGVWPDGISPFVLTHTMTGTTSVV